MYSSLFLMLGTEQEWKLAQNTMEAASNGLYSATNELCIASLKAKSASGYKSYINITSLQKNMLVHVSYIA
jgi:hypothetical protein